MSTTTTAPKRTKRPARIRSRFTMPSAMPMIGVESGAMIIAPMTVAVESASTPAVAITPDSTSIVQNADCLARVSPDRRSRSSESSSRVRRWFSGRTRSRRPMFMAPSMPRTRRPPARPGGDAPGGPTVASRRCSGTHTGTVETGGRHALVSHRQQPRRTVPGGPRPRGLLRRHPTDSDPQPDHVERVGHALPHRQLDLPVAHRLADGVGHGSGRVLARRRHLGALPGPRR